MRNLSERNRRSIRLRDFDYTRDGVYFVTICTQHRLALLGEIVDDEMRLNEIGLMVKHWWEELANKFTNVELDEYIIMPNHIHGLIVISSPHPTVVGADLCVCPGQNIEPPVQETKNRGADIAAPLQATPITVEKPTLGRVVRWFKVMTTNEYMRNVKDGKWESFEGKVWQRNYYERIVRNDREWNDTRAYIIHNPAQWTEDSENPANMDR